MCSDYLLLNQRLESKKLPLLSIKLIEPDPKSTLLSSTAPEKALISALAIVQPKIESPE